MARWRVEDSKELYNIPDWGRGLFDASDEGHLVLTANPDATPVDLKQLVDELVERGIDAPILLRFPDIVKRRLGDLAGAFSTAIAEQGYKGHYRGVYPIKVNQQRHLVEDIVQYARAHHMGLEAGSKPELLIVLALLDDPEAYIICNGYKDRGYIQTALLAAQLGRNPVIVIEKPSEVQPILQVSRELGVKPTLGVRAKLSSPGKGRWSSSSGDRAKFGLTALQIVEVVEELRAADSLDCLKLLHFHIGSQVTGIRTFKSALRESTRMYTELVAMGAPMGLFDVGGGLGVDYDGSKTDFDSSRNYSDYEYASDVVAYIMSACDEAGTAHPNIITESGRSLVAHHSMLVFDVTGVEQRPTEGRPPNVDAEDPEPLRDMRQIYDQVNARTFQSAWHEAMGVREEARLAFNMGLMNLEQFAQLERMFWQVCGRIRSAVKKADYVSDDLDALRHMLADTYYCNFSVFQSAPDSWAIGQLFPVVPLQRLDEEPRRRAVLADLTCDSDGKMDRFIDRRDVRRTLEVHSIEDGESYYLAIMLVGAYQEILGDLHNLFGDTNTAHIVQDESGYRIDRVVEGDRVNDVLSYVQYQSKDLIAAVRRATEEAISNGRLSRENSRILLRAYQRGLDSYTYLGGEE
ncbi:MAG: biosynthetic arginine decarboxylase [Alphaproteobacteria bacterium]|nr:biosynthetic arginine decarboxylase [Alphaproteobacteria bacterium]